MTKPITNICSALVLNTGAAFREGVGSPIQRDQVNVARGPANQPTVSNCRNSGEGGVCVICTMLASMDKIATNSRAPRRSGI